jgi:hypothetical protein
MDLFYWHSILSTESFVILLLHVLHLHFMTYSTGRQQFVMGTSCKQAAVFGCRDCSKAFCCTHVTDHRRKLGEEINEVISEHDHLKNIFTQHTSNPNLHPLIKQIDEWEKNQLK